MPEMRLLGCRARPLIGYMKALGVLRVVSLQADSSTRGRWSDGAFELRANLTGDELETFLLDRYSPAPVVSPWNGGSGFHPNDRKEAILALEEAAEPRFAAYRSAIGAAREALARLEIHEKPKPEMKLSLVRELRRSLPDDALPWLDAAIVVTGERVSYPPLLGSGGNDGRYDFSNNYAQAVVECLMSGRRASSQASLSAALHGGPAELQRKLSLGHLSRDSSPNNSPYGEADSLGNPWDLILAVEGTLLLVAGAARRLGSATGGTLVAPFTVRSTAAGYGSAVGGESGRAELWLPLWSGWASRDEIDMLARESRAQIGHGHSRRQARTGLDYARAAGTLGVAKGIDAFERYSILERAGQSSLAVPAGRIAVSERSASAQAIRSIDSWMRDVLRFGAGENCPREIQIATRRLERAGFALASRGSNLDACDMLEAIGAVEHALARSHSAVESGSVRPLRHAQAEPWIAAADDGTPEFAVAVSIASLHDRRRSAPALRDYLHGTQGSQNGGPAFDPGRRHVVEANSPMRLLAAIHTRRHLDAARRTSLEPADFESHSATAEEQSRTHRLHLAFDRGRRCKLPIARQFAAGALDERRVLRLIYGLALLDYKGTEPNLKTHAEGPSVLPAFDVLALAWMGSHMQHLPQEAQEMLGPRRGWAARLAAGAVRPVLADGMLRLRMASVVPIVTARDISSVSSDQQLGPRLCAALLLQISPADIESTAKRITTRAHPDDEQRKETA